MVLSQAFKIFTLGTCRSVFLCALVSGIIFIAGCGSSDNQTPGKSTTVTLMASSSANDQLFDYGIAVNYLTLIGQSGNTVNLLTTPLIIEFMHLNGTEEPLATVTIPDGVYTSASASLGGTGFSCATIGSNGSDEIHYFGDLDSVSASNVTVMLPKPVQITGMGMVLTLNLLVSQSESITSCNDNVFSITPTFSVSVTPLSVSPTNSKNGKLVGMEGVVASSNSATDSITVASADGSNYGEGNPMGAIDPANGPLWQITYNSGTKFQGITGASQLAAGLAVDMDTAIQSDGSLLATRIAVYDTNPTNTSLWVVPALFEDNFLGTEMLIGAKEEIGPVLGGNGAAIDFANSQFQISQQMSNLASLPFQPSFTAANMVAGQNIAPTFHAPNYGNNILGPSPSTITLLPQTINGTVSVISSEGGFTTYTTTLAPYDLFPALAVQPNQTTLLTNPSTLVVYADSNTRMLNTNQIAVGSVVRFYGLVFNDNGTLRMDCAQVNDGVTL